MEIAEKIINATQPEIIAWNSINWNHAKNQVQKTQARIVKALQEKRWRDVRSLQRMLTKSLSAKQLAVKQITENKGKLTPGVDGETWSGTKQKAEQVYKLQWKGYKAKPLRRIYIPKADGNSRPLGIPTVYDRAMQALQKMSLEPIAETLGDNHSYGFRPMRSAADAIEYSLCLLSKRNSARWILDADIRSCFDNIDHNWLIKNIPMNARILKQWLKSGYLEKGIKHETIMGTPQGGVISPIIANMTLDGMEDLIRKSFRSSKLKGENDKVNVVRYADDCVPRM
jgi:RNA-directed DNA polymerase